MFPTLQQILLKHWGYSVFRPLQEEIIRSVLEGNDTLALLPTGGGKSICFQVPALAREGICLVVSPLIALMKDQVENLKKKGIPAAALHSGMHPGEMDIILGNCRFGNIKLLYISPERLASDKFRESARRMKVNLIAVDEAHCISQWGYDFRPPYLEIAAIRPFFPDVPVLALTATATPKVVTDIMQKLEFRKENLFRKSFERKNLTYLVIREEDKLNRLVKILSKVKGPAIVYARNRKQTREVASFLEKKGIAAGYYHAGLDPATRNARQEAWTREQKPVIVATNAFGMGIDKPNVRVVVHLDIPDSIEAYFQEAGRAGRDEKQAWAVLLYEAADIQDARRNLDLAYPELQKIKDVYQAVGNYFQVPVGMGGDSSHDFELNTFSEQYGFQPVTVFNSLKFLEKEGYLSLNEGIMQPSRICIRATREDLYRFRVEHADIDFFIKTMLRSYGGILSDFTPVSEQELANRCNITTDKVIANIRYLERTGMLDYLPRKEKPQLMFSQNRVDPRHLTISATTYHDRLKEAEKRLNKMISYAETSNKCRSQVMLAYFGDCQARRCGKCDVCIERNKVSLNELEFNNIISKIKPLLRERPCTIEEIVGAASGIEDDKVLRAIQWLAENDKISVDESRMYRWI